MNEPYIHGLPTSYLNRWLSLRGSDHTITATVTNTSAIRVNILRQKCFLLFSILYIYSLIMGLDCNITKKMSKLRKTYYLCTQK